MKAQAGDNRTFGIILLFAFIGLILWLLFSRKANAAITRSQPEDVEAKILYPDDEASGAHQFASSMNSTVPSGLPELPFVGPPFFVSNYPTQFKTGIPLCPFGYSLWKDITTNKFWCFPEKDFS